MKALAAVLCCFGWVVSSAHAQEEDLVALYKKLHSHPELSHHEEQTSALLAAELRKTGYTVTERVGRYPDGTQAFGIVGVLKNGTGPELLIRGDMDGLPVIEETGLPYASQVRTKNASGQEVGVMHACGHDVHVTTLIGTARALAAAKDRWHGTLLIVGQPSEETIDGAKAMMADQLYDRFGKPNFAIALHDSSIRAAGTVSVTSGPALASSTSVDVVMRGVGGHGAMPQNTKDPVVMAAEFIVQLQTIVSRQENPIDPTVVTVGDIHGGTKRNITPNDVKMELTVRSFSDKARAIVLDGIRRDAKAAALAAGVPEDRQPLVNVIETESTPVLYNDPALTARLRPVLEKALGTQNVITEMPIMGSEDFGIFGLENHQIPTVMIWLGAMEPDKLASAQAAGTLLPGLHTSRFAPQPEPTLSTGVKAMTGMALELLGRKAD